MFWQRLFISILFSVTFLFNGCAGGAGGSDPTPSRGIDGSGFNPTHGSSGSVNGFGSIIVNGVHYNTDDTEFFVSGDVAMDSDLAVGDYVTVLGAINSDGVTGTAAQVIFQPNVVGAIESINNSGNSFVVLGQTIFVNQATVFSGNITKRFIDGLAVGDTVRVSGPANGNGSVIATSVEKREAGQLELIGLVSNLDKLNSTMLINGQLVNIATASILQEDFEALNNGTQVAVFASTLENNALIAVELKILTNNLDVLAPESSAELSGIVDVFTSVRDFRVANTLISVSDDTQYINGDESDLGLDVNIKLTGKLNELGVVIADQIEFLIDVDNLVVGEVQGISGSSEGINAGSITIAGDTFITNSSTHFVDYSESRLPRFNLENIVIGDTLSISGVRAGSDIIATLVERENPGGPVSFEFRGFETDITVDSVRLFRYDIVFDDETVFIINDQVVNAEIFVNRATGGVIEVKGESLNSIITADIVTLLAEFSL